jgi:flagellar motor switch protein FliG
VETAAASRWKSRAPEVKEPAAKEPNGLQKAAILILSMDEETASRVLKSLSDPEAELVTRELAKLGIIEKERVAQVLAEFGELAKVEELIRTGGPNRALKLIRKGFPPATARRLTRLLEAQKHSTPFAFLKNAEMDSLHTFLKEEHPQTVALVLSYLEPAKAAEVLSKLPAERQFDIVERIAHLEHSSPEAIKHVESGLQRHLSSLPFEDADSPELVQETKELTFIFEDIAEVDDKCVQNVLKEVDRKQLALALKTASPELKEKIFKNMSRRAAEMVKEEIGLLGPVRVADVESAQEEIVDIVRRLEEAGHVAVLGRGGEGEQIV